MYSSIRINGKRTYRANGGIRVGLSVEPTVSYSSKEKVKMRINVF